MATESPFWRFSLDFYRRDGVAPACLALQDEAGADVNLLLLLLWTAREGRRLSAGEIAEIDGLCAPWRAAAVMPLREVRRSLKAPPALVPRAAAEAFRDKIKGAELEAERLQQQAMYDWTQRGARGDKVPEPTAAAVQMIADYAALTGRTFPRDAVNTIITAFAAARA